MSRHFKPEDAHAESEFLGRIKKRAESERRFNLFTAPLPEEEKP